MCCSHSGCSTSMRKNNTRPRPVQHGLPAPTWSPSPSDFAPALDDVAPERFSAMAHPVNSATQHFGRFCPDGGGDTMFANMYLAYEMLSEPIRKFIDGLTAVHDGEKHYRGRYGNDDRGKVYPRAEHPIVRTHPRTGQNACFVNRFFTTHIVGLHKSESNAILEMLYRHIETPELSMRFKWTPNSVAFWDNRCTQHHALWDYYPHRRYGHRVTVCGQKPY